MSQKNWDNSNKKSGGQGFGLGLLVGGMAGVAAYFMFGTEQGEKLKKKLVEEFEYAQIKIPQDIAQILQESEAHQKAQESGKVDRESVSLAAKIVSNLTSERKKRVVEVEKEKKKVLKKTKKVFTKSGRKIG